MVSYMVKKKKFRDFAVSGKNSNWEQLIQRPSDLYARIDDVRSPFARDYTRILHSMAYRRLKHKTQVFFNIDNDHICTRMEHVAHVESVSNTIATNLGLNTELTRAIAMGHDLGHAPFGHHGEAILSTLSKKHLGSNFWHEKNGLRFVDCVELLPDNHNNNKNLNLTYAVRDGIISHCGEIDLNGLRPRTEFIELEKKFNTPGQYQPVTWEGCVVKLADKIAYIGRDIEDAIRLSFLDAEDLSQLQKMAQASEESALNTTVIMHNLIIDVCKNSSPEKGICMSENLYEQLKEIKKFNYSHIYENSRLDAFKKYANLALNQLFEVLFKTYDKMYSWSKLDEVKMYYPNLVNSFERWLLKYCDSSIVPQGDLKSDALKCENVKIYELLNSKKLYAQAIIDFIAGMTDRFVVELFNEQISYNERI